MDSDIKTQKSFEASQEMTGIGWWLADRKTREVTLSAFLKRLLNLKSDKLSFDAFKEHLHPDAKETVFNSLRRLFARKRNGDLDFSFQTSEGYQLVRIKLTGCTVENGEVVSAEGSLQCLNVSDQVPDQPGTSQTDLIKLLRWQKSFTHSLKGLLDNSANDTALEAMLELILQNYNADAIRIYSVDYDNRFLTCVYEKTTGRATPIKDHLQHVKFDSNFWVGTTLGKKASCQEHVSDEFYKGIPVSENYQRPTAYMVNPLLVKDDVWGFIKLDMVGGPRKWTYIEKETFQSIANIIGVCLALRQSEKQAVKNGDFLHKLFLNMPLGYFTLRIEKNEEGRVTDYEYLDVNTMFTEMVGKSRDEIVGKMHTEFGPIFVEKLDLQVLARVAYQGEIFYTRGQIRHNKRYYNTTIYCPRVGDIVALFSDVTDTVLASEALRQSEEELKKVYTNIPVGIEIYDKNGVLVEVNDKELEIQGVPSKDLLLGLNLFDHPALPKSAYDQLRAGKDVTFDVNTEFKQANYDYYKIAGMPADKYLTIKCTVLHNSKGEVENYLLIVIDNTEMYQAMLRLREFEGAFNSVAEIAEIGFFKWNPLKGEAFGSDQYLRNMGLKPEDSNNFLIYRETVHPDDVRVLDQFLEDATAGKTNSITHEIRVRDGENWKWLRTSCFITQYDPEVNNVQFVGVNYNINEMKLTEVELFEAKSRAEEADRLKTAFLANMSHEIRTPLNAIVGFSGILVDTDDKEDQKQFFSIIKKNNDHLLNLISDILDISKIEAGTVDVTPGYLMAEDICGQVIDSLSIKNEMGIDMRFIPNEQDPNVLMESDMKRITQVLSNFISNALKFTRQGHVLLSYKVIGEDIEFSVEDTGIGIAPEHVERLFERFFKVDDFIPGTGLGLSISKTIALRLGGSVGAESTLGAGSRFWFRVPLVFKPV